MSQQRSKVVKGTEQSTMKKTTQQPILKYASALPSTSKVPYESEETDLETFLARDLSHIKSLPSNKNDGGKKYMQVTPIKILPKPSIPNKVQLRGSPFTGVNLGVYPTLQVGAIAPGAGSGNIPITNNPTSFCKVTGSLIEIFTKPIEQSVPSQSFAALPVGATGTSISVIPYRAASQTLSNMTVPQIFQGQALKETLSAKSECKDNKNAVLTISDIEKLINASIQQEQASAQSKGTSTANENEMLQDKFFDEPSARYPIDNKMKIMMSPRKTRPQKYVKKEPKDNLTEEDLYVADGFREDVEILLEKCLQVYVLTFEKFTSVWKEMNFPRTLHGRQSNSELAELSEEMIHIAKGYMVAREASFEKNVAGLFLVYALLNHQPFSKFAPLRLVPHDVPYVLRLEAYARQNKRQDVLYVLGSVLIKGPCQFHVQAREVSLEAPIKKYFDDTVRVSRHVDSVFTRTAESVPLLKKLVALEASKRNIRTAGKAFRKADKPSQCKEPAAAMLQSFYEHVPGLAAERPPDNSVTTSTSNTTGVTSIKQKAMALPVDPMRHLTGVGESSGTGNKRIKQQGQTELNKMSSSSEDSPSGAQTYPKLKPKWRSKASMVQQLFATEQTPEDLKANQQPIIQPAIDDFDERYKLSVKKKSPIKAQRYVKNSDTKKSPSKKPIKKKLDNIQNSPAKRIVPDNSKSMMILDMSDPDLDLINIDDIVSGENRIRTNLDILNEFLSDSDDGTSKKNAKSENVTGIISENLHVSLDDGINIHNTNTAVIDDKKADDDIEVESGCKEVLTKTKGGQKRKNTKRKDAVSKDDAEDVDSKGKIVKNTKIKKADLPNPAVKQTKIKKSPNKSSAKMRDLPLIIDTNESESTSPKRKKPTRRKTSTDADKLKTISNEPMKSPKSKARQTQRTEPQRKLSTAVSRQSPRKRKNTSEEESDMTIPKKKCTVGQGVNSRIKSTFKRLGLLEVASDER